MLYYGDVVYQLVAGHLLDLLKELAALLLDGLQLVFFLLERTLQRGFLVDELEPVILMGLGAFSVVFLVAVGLVQKFLNSFGQTVDQSAPLLLLSHKFFDLLLIGVLVVVESILDGQDVLVYRDSVSEELKIGLHVLSKVDRFGHDAPDLFIAAI